MAESSGAFSNYAVREIREAHKSRVAGLDWNCQGKKLASGCADGSIKIWSVEPSATGKDRKDAELALDCEPNELVWHPSHPEMLAAAGGDNLVKVFDVRTSKVAYTTKLKRSGYMFLAWNPAVDVLAAVHKDSETFFIDSRNQKVLSSMPSDREVNEVRFSKDGKLFFRCVGSDIEIYSYPELTKLHTYIGHSAMAYCLDFTDNERIMATGGQDSIVTISNMETLTSLRSFIIMDTAVKKIGFSMDGQHLAYSCIDPGIFIEKWRSGARATFLETPDQVSSMKWNPKHLVLAYNGSFLEGGRMGRSFGNISIYAPKVA